MWGHYQKLQTFPCWYVESQNKESILLWLFLLPTFVERDDLRQGWILKGKVEVQKPML